ncbi:MAG: DUF3459 domain-containing protein, partial [Desulfonatronovibrio sp.]
DYHFDGLRIDAVHAIFDTSAIHFLEQLSAEVKQMEAYLGRNLVLIAESDLNDPRIVRPSQAGGYGLDAQWNEDFHHALHAVLTGEKQGYYADFGDLAALAKVMKRNFAYDGRYSVYRSRIHGRPASDICPHKLVGCMQNHDQVGNRAFGERSTHLLSRDQLKISAALVLTSPFVPMLFQGEEWGAASPFLYFTAHEDPELAEAVRQGRRREFSAFDWPQEKIPDPQSLDTFERSRLNWEEPQQELHAEILEWHKKIINLRRTLPDLTDGRPEQLQISFHEEKKWLIIRRGRILLAFNLAARPRSIQLPRVPENSRFLLTSHENLVLNKDCIHMPPYSTAIVD